MRRLINIIRNSRLHAFISNILEKFQLEGFTISYSQGGEDLIIKKLVSNKRNGTYADIGCNNPIQKSNTYKLYLKGWTGICVDGNESLIRQFKKIRPKDTSLTEIVSDTKKKMTFYQFTSNHEMSTLAEERGEAIAANSPDIQKIEVTSTTLEEIFNEYLNDRQLDLLCVDVEDHDLQVLKGNNFSKFRPRVICAEQSGSIEYVKVCPITTFLESQDYEIAAFCGSNIYFKDKTIPV